MVATVSQGQHMMSLQSPGHGSPSEPRRPPASCTTAAPPLFLFLGFARWPVGLLAWLVDLSCSPWLPASPHELVAEGCGRGAEERGAEEPSAEPNGPDVAFVDTHVQIPKQ